MVLCREQVYKTAGLMFCLGFLFTFFPVTNVAALSYIYDAHVAEWIGWRHLWRADLSAWEIIWMWLSLPCLIGAAWGAFTLAEPFPHARARELMKNVVDMHLGIDQPRWLVNMLGFVYAVTLTAATLFTFQRLW